MTPPAPHIWEDEAGRAPTDASDLHGKKAGLDMRTLRSLLQTLERLLPVGPLRVVLHRLAGTEPTIREVDEFGMDPAYVEEVAPLLDLLHDRYFRVEVEGAEHIAQADGPIIVVANHAGSLPWDAVMLAHTVRRFAAHQGPLRPLLEDYFFHFPYLGMLMNRLGAVRACRENAERLLGDGFPVAAFPEGLKGASKLYRDRYRIQRFGRGGTIRLAVAADAQLIPAAIIGPEEIHPLLMRLPTLGRPLGLPFLPITPTFPWLGPLGLVPLPARWRIRFGPPISLAAYRNAELDRLTINRLNEELRQTIQAMVGALLEVRGGIFR